VIVDRSSSSLTNDEKAEPQRSGAAIGLNTEEEFTASQTEKQY
jgi:hypothetical protein